MKNNDDNVDKLHKLAKEIEKLSGDALTEEKQNLEHTVYLINQKAHKLVHVFETYRL